MKYLNRTLDAIKTAYRNTVLPVGLAVTMAMPFAGCTSRHEIINDRETIERPAESVDSKYKKLAESLREYVAHCGEYSPYSINPLLNITYQKTFRAINRSDGKMYHIRVESVINDDESVGLRLNFSRFEHPKAIHNDIGGFWDINTDGKLEDKIDHLDNGGSPIPFVADRTIEDRAREETELYRNFLDWFEGSGLKPRELPKFDF